MAGRFKGLALTFDDILLEPAKSSVFSPEVNLGAPLTKKIKIDIPFPIPCSVISSPSHINKIVPAVIVKITANRLIALKSPISSGAFLRISIRIP